MDLARFIRGANRRSAGWSLPARIPRALLVFLLAIGLVSAVLPAATAAGAAAAGPPADPATIGLAETGAFQAMPAPAAPSNLHLCGSIVTWPPELCPVGGPTLIWNDNSVNETRFEFEWTIAQVGVPPWQAYWNRVTLPANRRAYRPKIAVSGVLYLFRVRACNTVCSPYSNMVSYAS
jgi:hypothetical protein